MVESKQSNISESNATKTLGNLITPRSHQTRSKIVSFTLLANKLVKLESTELTDGFCFDFCLV